MTRDSLPRIALRVFIGVYLALGIYTEIGLMEILPLPQNLIADFLIYERAAKDAATGSDPYLEKRIGAAFVYPPQSLLLFEAFGSIKDRTTKAAIFAVVNITLLVYMTRGVIQKYGLASSDAWFFYPLALGFAPFLELLHIGQINQIVAFGLFLVFAFSSSSPLIAGLGLGSATMLKVTPAVFGIYLILKRKWKTLASTIVTILFFSLLTWLRYGSSPFIHYLDAFQSILRQFPEGLESHSLVSVINRQTNIEPYVTSIQTGLNLYLLLIIASATISHYTRNMDLFFVTLALGVTMTPNLLWYHHYVFLLLPLFILMSWSKLDPRVVAWCLFGFIIIQVDRFYLTAGLLIHIFVHLTILGLIGYQVREALQQYRHTHSLTA